MAGKVCRQDKWIAQIASTELLNVDIKESWTLTSYDGLALKPISPHSAGKTVWFICYCGLSLTRL